jgi:hypothetical protein
VSIAYNRTKADKVFITVIPPEGSLITKQDSFVGPGQGIELEMVGLELGPLEKAAPELLKALKELQPHKHSLHNLPAEILDAAEKAIAKAEGLEE